MNIRGSVVIRKHIIRIFKKHSLDYHKISQYLCIKYYPFIMWLNANDGGNGFNDVSEIKVRKLCQLLGIEIKDIDKYSVQIIIHPLPESTLKIGQNEKYVRYFENKKYKEKINNDKFFEDETETRS